MKEIWIVIAGIIALGVGFILFSFYLKSVGY